jgi:hypothetical protein
MCFSIDSPHFSNVNQPGATGSATRHASGFEKALDELGAWQRKAQPMIDFCSNVLSI